MKKILACLVSLLLYFMISFSASAQISMSEAKNFQIEKLEGRELILAFTMEVENQTGKGIGVKIKKGKLYKDGQYYGNFQLMDKVKLKSKTKEDVNVRVKVSLVKDLKIAEEAMMALMGKSIELKLTGKLKATWFIFWKNYRFEHKEKISLKNFMR